MRPRYGRDRTCSCAQHLSIVSRCTCASFSSAVAALLPPIASGSATRVRLTEMWARLHRDAAKMRARCGRDAGEMQPRCGRDAGEMRLICGRDTAEMRARSHLAARPESCSPSPRARCRCQYPMCAQLRMPRIGAPQRRMTRAHRPVIIIIIIIIDLSYYYHHHYYCYYY